MTSFLKLLFVAGLFASTFALGCGAEAPEALCQNDEHCHTDERCEVIPQTACTGEPFCGRCTPRK